MKHTIRFIILLFSLVMTGVSDAWADITENDIIINVLPNKTAGTVSVTNISGMTVTITATPATGYTIDATHILVEKMVDPMAASRRAPGMAPGLEVTPGEGNTYSFTIPEGFSGAYVTATFYKKAEGFIQITSLSDITDMNGKYQLTADVSGISRSLAEFKGTLDGGLHKIIGSSAPLFASTDGAIIRNIIFEDVNISSGDGDGDAGAVTSKAKGATRIYNCGILPTSVERDDKGKITGFYGSSVGGTGNVGGLVGTLSGTARVINCFSYANITGGANKGGIVGSNEETSTQASFTTMVMNCLFYGDISNGGNISPIYGGTEINNVTGGLNNYNYYRYNSSYSTNKHINKYNRALAMEEKFITRFERYRLLLNSNKKLAAKYTSTATVTVEPNDMAKWILETADRTIENPYPYPILKAQGYYPSIINPDIKNAPDSASVGRNHGGKLGKTLIVHIAGVGSNAPDGAKILRRGPITLQRTDKDTIRFNFNYDKVQLPYYNDYGTKNYTGYRVVTGWKITSITGGTAGTFKEADEWGGYNFADRKCTNKDLYSVSKRVFSQGAYWDVPEGVTAITIEPNWAVANYVSDEYYDVVYDASYNKKSYTMNGKQYTSGKIVVDGSEQTVYTNISSALAGFSTEGKTVYDQAVVLVGNVHQYDNPTNTNKPYTVMSIDMNHDNEPDYSYIFTHDNRKPIDPIRYDFLNIMGMAEAQIPNGATLLRNVSIFNLKGWFEITNTCLVNFSQFEIENSQASQNAVAKSPAPLILLGGTDEQIASTQKTSKPASTQYIHVGGNAWFAKFGNGTHSDGSGFTPHIPISVTGGDYDEFYLSGTYQPNIDEMQSDNAECYISGGRFGEMAGASLEAIWGDVRWDINWADITNFYGGGVNAVNPITGNIRIDMTNSYVNRYCGGPKYGEMTDEKTVTTNATGCVFGTYFGAGYGGNAYNRVKYRDESGKAPADNQNLYTNERGKYYDGITTDAYSAHPAYGKKGKGVATDFDSEFFIWSSGVTGARFYIKFISFSLATTHGVTSNLTKCKVTGNVYGGGSLGKVEGNVSTKLKDCEVSGNVFGAGFSATIPKVEVRKTPAFIAGKEPTKNMNIGMFESGEINTTEEYEWKQVATSDLSNGGTGMVTENGKNYVYTDTNLSALGIVTGDATLEIQGTTTVGGSVYGGGEESGVEGNTIVTVTGGTIGTTGKGGVEYGNVYGGGKGKVKDVTAGFVKGNTSVTISQAEGKTTRVYHNVYGGGAYGSVGDFNYDANNIPTSLKKENTGTTNVNITGGTFGWNGSENGMVFGSSRGDVAKPEGTPAVDPNDRMAWVYSTQVNIGTENATGPTIKGSIYGSGENGHTLQNTELNIFSGTIGIPTGEIITDDNGTPDDDTDDIEYSGANYPYRGNVYGGGCGTDTYKDGTEDKYNPLAGIVKGKTTINIKGGHVVRNVYGAGAMGSVGGGTTTDAGKTSINVTGGRIGYDGNSNNDGCIFGAARGENGISTATSNLANVRETEVNINAHPTDATKSPVIWGSVFGGGEAGTVKEGVAVNMTGGLIHKDIYGGGALADTQTSNWNTTGGTWADAQKSALHTTTVRATGGRVVEEIFGGGLGEDGKPAYVFGDVTVELNKDVADNSKGCAVGQIFGCNNVNGTPKGDVMVHIYATQNAEADKIANTPATGTEGEEGYKPADETQKVIGRYDVSAVYGGGNMAAYEPADPDNNKSEVIIDGCQLTSIKTVYGGGNAACTPSTNVTVNGTFEVEELFGGGNGLDDIVVNGVTKPNPGANVGYNNYSEYYQEGSVWKVRDKADADTKEERLASSYVYGTGKASVNIFGGTVHRVFGGSNTKGNVRQTAVTLLDENSGCDFCVDEAYGGGKSAEMDAEAKLLMACIPGLEAVYGGAEAADVRGNVTLNITNGTFDRVFGGNNLSGTISGSITVNVEEIGCKPVKIGELYGGGNEAGYSVYGYDSDGKPVESGTTPLYNDPQVNVMSFTSIGNIYGGGYGEGATMVGNPTVNINVAYGRWYDNTTGNTSSVVGENAKTPNNYPIPSHATGKIGAISNVFGGGNAAKVIGNTTVNVGTLSEVYVVKQVTVGDDVSSLYIRNNNGTYSKASGTAQDGTTYYEEQDVIGADIRGNVYGGGNAAEVTGNTNVTIGKDATN